jgi:hypothetical protein
MTRLDFWARPGGSASGEKMGPKTRGGSFAQNLPAKVGSGLLRVAPLPLSGSGPQPVHKNEPRPTPGLLRISYLAFALAAAAAVAEGSAKAITASPSVKLP